MFVCVITTRMCSCAYLFVVHKLLTLSSIYDSSFYQKFDPIYLHKTSGRKYVITNLINVIDVFSSHTLKSILLVFLLHLFLMLIFYVKWINEKVSHFLFQIFLWVKHFIADCSQYSLILVPRCCPLKIPPRYRSWAYFSLFVTNFIFSLTKEHSY